MKVIRAFLQLVERIHSTGTPREVVRFEWAGRQKFYSTLCPKNINPYSPVLLRVYPWIPVTVFWRRIKMVYKHGPRIRKTSTNSRIHPALKLLQLQHLRYRLTRRTKCLKYGYNKIQSAEIFDLLAWWCQQKKEFQHITDLVYVIHAITASSETSETSFSTAGRVIRERRTYLRPNTRWPYPFSERHCHEMNN